MAAEEQVLEILRGLVREMGQERALRALSLNALLDRDLGLDSLSRIELLHRVEQTFRIRLPDRVIATAQTPLDVVRAVREAEGETGKTLYRPPIRHEETLSHPVSAQTLIQVLTHHVESDPRRTHLYLHREEQEELKISYGHLLNRALQVANGLRDRGIVHNETVAIMLPTGEDFFYAFFGVLLAGGIPVPIYPPFRPDRLAEYAQRQSTILRNAGVRILVTFHRVEALARALRTDVPTLAEVTGVEELSKARGALTPAVVEDDIALIQYTSGSTGDPRGVVLTHRNLLANIRAFGDGMSVRPTDVGVSWLPLYHDMGLIGAWLGSLYYSVPLAVLPPESFLHRPERWLWAIHYHQATLSAAPNFAYELCARRVEDSVLEGLDLRSWRAAFNGAEPVSPDTMDRFSARFAPYGFRPESFLPVYGLAESSLAVSFPPLGRLPRVDRVTRRLMNGSRRMDPADPADPAPLRFVSCGFPLPGHQVRIVDDLGKPLNDRMEGRLHFFGPSSMQGYYRNPEATRAVVHGAWIDSGDLAYQADGELFITGRAKDTIIKTGRNLYPQEIEELAGEVPGIRKGCVAAFGVSDERTGTERLIIAAESRETEKKRQEEILARVTDKIAEILGVPPDEVLLIPPGAIPKTSSGKIQRSSSKDLYLAGRLGARRPAVSWQMTGLFLKNLRYRCFGLARKIQEGFYGLYVWGLVGVSLFAAYLFVLAIPHRSGVIRVSRLWARRFLRLAGYPVRVEGSSHLESGGPFVLVSNHASYIDALALLAALPIDFVFVAKQELVQRPFLRTLLRKGGHLTVDRRDPARGLSDVEGIKRLLKDGVSVLIFPEGTAARATGIRPFTLGAFRVAVETRTAICPIALRGTRQIMRPDHWWPRRGEIDVHIGPLIRPEESDWNEIIRLRDVVKAVITQHSGERPLDLVLAGLPPE